MPTSLHEVPDVVVQRLPLYVRALSSILREGADVVSSHQLGSRLQITPAQIRKDLSYFGRFGKQGRGYDVRFLLSELGQILGLDRSWKACLIGMGRLGQAIINYPGFAPEGFEIVAAFDSAPPQVGKSVGQVKVRPMGDLTEAIEKLDISIAIVAVPRGQAQSVVDRLVNTGIKGILNYAPVALKVPARIVARNIDPVLSLQSLTFYLLRNEQESAKGAT